MVAGFYLWVRFVLVLRRFGGLTVLWIIAVCLLCVGLLAFVCTLRLFVGCLHTTGFRFLVVSLVLVYYPYCLDCFWSCCVGDCVPGLFVLLGLLFRIFCGCYFMIDLALVVLVAYI